jgi:hypothetical protein
MKMSMEEAGGELLAVIVLVSRTGDIEDACMPERFAHAAAGREAETRLPTLPISPRFPRGS